MVSTFLRFSLLVCWLLLADCAIASFRLVVIDIGEGQAVLLQQGEKGLLIDTGHFGKQAVLLSTLKKYGIETVEKVILTHLHGDHASGVFALKHAFPEAMIYESGHRMAFDPAMDLYRWVAEQLDSGQWPVSRLRMGDTLMWRDVRLDILWPEEVAGNDPNAQSLVIEVIYGSSHTLIMGDVDTAVERLLLQQGALPAAIDVLVVGHHGAADATSSELLDRLSPAAAVISVNGDNLRGYPAPEVVERIQAKKIDLHITAEKGDFVFNGSMVPRSTLRRESM